MQPVARILKVITSKSFGLFGSRPPLENEATIADLGAVETVNIDGGDSTTMVIHNKIVNNPPQLKVVNGRLAMKY